MLNINARAWVDLEGLPFFSFKYVMPAAPSALVDALRLKRFVALETLPFALLFIAINVNGHQTNGDKI